MYALTAGIISLATKCVCFVTPALKDFFKNYVIQYNS